jgi:trehalose/maltose transport system permease protein
VIAVTRFGNPRSAAATGWLFLAPMLLALALAAGWPLARTVWLSFHGASLADPAGYPFIGLRNYLGHEEGVWFGVLADPDWWRAVRNTLAFTAISVTLEACLGVAVALVLNASFPGRALVRAAVLVPWAVPTIVSAKIWAWMLNDQFGVVNRVLLALGLIETPLAWTADPHLALAAVVMVDVWKTTPFVALLVLAALQMIPEQCYEAARLDGAGPLQQFAYVTLPLIRPALIVAIIFRTLDGLRVFDLFYVLTSNSPDTMSMSVYARQQLIDFQDLGFGSAASTLVFAVVALCSVLLIAATRLRMDPVARA